MFLLYLGMNIITSDNSLAYVISDNTTGSGKSKRGGRPKVASTGQDVLTSSITKYLDNNAKFENSNAARQLTIEEEKLKLEQRKMDLQEKQHALAEQQLRYQGQGYGIAYGGPRSGQQYHNHCYDRPALDQEQYHDQQLFAERQQQQQYNSRQHHSGYQNPYGRSVPDRQHYARQGYQDPYEQSVPYKQHYTRQGYQDPYEQSVPDKQHYTRQGYQDPYEPYYYEPYDAQRQHDNPHKVN